MPFSQEQIKNIIDFDLIGKDILRQGGQEALLMSVIHKMPELKNIIDSAEHEELDFYCEKYNGFYSYMKMLEMFARGCADGIFNDILQK